MAGTVSVQSRQTGSVEFDLLAELVRTKLTTHMAIGRLSLWACSTQPHWSAGGGGRRTFVYVCVILAAVGLAAQVRNRCFVQTEFCVLMLSTNTAGDQTGPPPSALPIPGPTLTFSFGVTSTGVQGCQRS